MKCELSNNIKFLALKYHCLTKKSLERSFRWAKRNFDSYFKLIDKYKYEKNDLYIEKEFIIIQRNQTATASMKPEIK